MSNPSNSPSNSPSGYAACGRGYANFARRTMYAHRLWIRLWITLGHPEENLTHPGGNEAVTSTRPLAAHSRAAAYTRAGHRQCERPHRPLAARTPVIPGIHRPYDDYQFLIRDNSHHK